MLALGHAFGKGVGTLRRVVVSAIQLAKYGLPEARSDVIGSKSGLGPFLAAITNWRDLVR